MCRRTPFADCGCFRCTASFGSRHPRAALRLPHRPSQIQRRCSAKRSPRCVNACCACAQRLASARFRFCPRRTASCCRCLLCLPSELTRQRCTETDCRSRTLGFVGALDNRVDCRCHCARHSRPTLRKLCARCRVGARSRWCSNPLSLASSKQISKAYENK